MKRCVVMLMIVCVAIQAQALYVDAQPGSAGNTVQASDGDPDAWWVNATAEDGLWGFRGFGFDQAGVLNGDSIYESSGTGSGIEDSMPIITTASGLTPGQLYEVSVVYWSSESQNWSVRAGFDAENMTLYDRLGDAGATAGTLMEGFHDGDRDPYAGLIGTIAADGNGQINVYIDDKPSDSSNGGWYDRTWYDGLELTVVPEPATLVLLGVGGLLLRRKR